MPAMLMSISGFLFRLGLPFLKFGAGLFVFAMFFVFLKDIFNFLLNATDILKNISASFNSAIPQVMQLYSFLGIHKFILMIIAAHLLSVSITITMVAMKAFGRKLPILKFKK